MGCDGGTIPRRDELVKTKKKPEQKDKQAELAFKWKHCAIRQLPLQPPVVGCSLGRLYTKESVLEGLLDRNTLPDSAVHIKNLKDVRNLNLTPNPAFNGDRAEKGDGYTDRVAMSSPYICPVIGLEMNGKYKFCFLWSCGCVMSERALKEVKSWSCHKCQQPYEDVDIVVLNAEGDDLELMKERAVLRRITQKKSKKRKSSDVCMTTGGEGKSSEGDDRLSASRKKIKKEDKVVPNLMNNPSDDPAYKKAKSDYSIAKDPRASEVFKSIFTSHKSAVEQDRAHWVTYNPFYN
ncbi:PREDICTED: protein RTF2 homolog [Dinoponera quadriceps]|uniref:Replication termination factor 2 n=1 Tax=Dinoponera quadriceps TaxID=609295 RepID=A0A6P3YH99_DINQU|nr:PREDICTED: protein RTF2 homolog [Dinoponera quadriceps]